MLTSPIGVLLSCSLCSERAQNNKKEKSEGQEGSLGNHCALITLVCRVQGTWQLAIVSFYSHVSGRRTDEINTNLCLQVIKLFELISSIKVYILGIEFSSATNSWMGKFCRIGRISWYIFCLTCQKKS